MATPVYKYMDQRGLTGQYSQFVIAGAAIKTETHRRALAEFRRAVGTRHPKLTIETSLMALAVRSKCSADTAASQSGRKTAERLRQTADILDEVGRHLAGSVPAQG